MSIQLEFKEIIDDHKAFRLKKSLYGLKQSLRARLEVQVIPDHLLVIVPILKGI